MGRKFTKRTTAKQTPLGVKVNTPALYIRVSTEKQADEGYSLAAQLDRLTAYCAAQGWLVDAAHIYKDEGLSASSTARPAYQAMLAAVDAGQVNRIVAIKLDRLSRNTRDFLTLLDYCDDRKCGIVSLAESFDTSTSVGRAVVTVLMTFAELERKQIAERVQMGRQQKASEGGYNGSRCPYGYTYTGGVWTVDENAADIVRSIFDLFIVDRYSLTRIADKLNIDEVPTQRGARGRRGKGETPADERGGKWYAATVRYILSNGVYAGVRQWNGTEVDDADFPTIIDRSTYDAAQRRLDELKPGRVTA